MSTETPTPSSHPLRERLIAVFRFSKWFPKKASRRSCEKKRSSRTKADVTGAQKKARSGKKNVKDTACEAPQKSHLQEHHITSIANTTPAATRPKIANYEPPKQYTSRRIGSTSVASTRSHSGPLISGMAPRSYSVAQSRRNSGTQSVPVSGELRPGGPKVVRSSSKSFTKLRDQYVKAMLKLGDMADSVAIGSSVTFESQPFESEVIRKRSQTENEIMDYYLNSSIQPDEWKNANMGSRINRNVGISV